MARDHGDPLTVVPDLRPSLSKLVIKNSEPELIFSVHFVLMTNSKVTLEETTWETNGTELAGFVPPDFLYKRERLGWRALTM